MPVDQGSSLHISYMGDLALSQAAAETRALKGLDNIIRALRLPRGTSPRTVATWIEKLGMPLWRIVDPGPYYAYPEELEAWWSRFRKDALSRLREENK